MTNIIFIALALFTSLFAVANAVSSDAYALIYGYVNLVCLNKKKMEIRLCESFSSWDEFALFGKTISHSPYHLINS